MPYHRRRKARNLDGTSEPPEVAAATLIPGENPGASLRLLVERIGAVVWSNDADGRLTSFLAPAAPAEDADPQELTSSAAHRAAMAGKSSRFQATWRGRTYD